MFKSPLPNLAKTNDTFSPERIIKGAVSGYENNCDGYGTNGASGNNYILGLVLGAGLAKFNLRHDGSQVLDEINAFDKAEVANTNLGQINMTIVSSFCGPAGVIWGYDIAKADNLREHHQGFSSVDGYGQEVPVYSAKALVDASRKLLGTIEEKRFPFMPGSHVPCAGKNFKDVGPRHVYAGIAIGIAKDRSKQANLLMEDLGWIPLHQDEESLKSYKRLILRNLAKSVLEIGANQQVEFSEIFTEMVDIKVPEGHIGCALVAAPYLTIAKKALPGGNATRLANISLSDWEKSVL